MIFDHVRDLDGAAVRKVVVGLMEDNDLDAVVSDALVPVMHSVGDAWEDGSLTILHEHHASSVVRSIVAQIPWDLDDGGARPQVVLACPPGELHDIPTHLFGLMLRARGLEPFITGADTPWRAIQSAAELPDTRGCVLSGIDPLGLSDRHAIGRLPRRVPLFTAGPAAAGCRVRRVVRLSNDWRTAADTVATTILTKQTERSGQPAHAAHSQELAATR